MKYKIKLRESLKIDVILRATNKYKWLLEVRQNALEG